MKKIVCEMCECTEFVKENGMFVCQECGCKYTVEDARALMVEVPDESAKAEESQLEPEEKLDLFSLKLKEFPLHHPGSPNRISVTVDGVGHETYTMNSVVSLSMFFGDPKPEFIPGPDVVGHIGAQISVKNHTGNPIKYIVVYLTPYNAVGDEVGCTVQGHSTYGIEVTGPLPVGESWQGYSDGMWYNSSIVGAKVAFATVEFMDGTKELLNADSLTYIEQINETMALVTVCYDCIPNGNSPLTYTFDGGEACTIMKGQSQIHYLSPGLHTFSSIKNPLWKRDYNFMAVGSKTIYAYGKPFTLEISEQ